MRDWRASNTTTGAWFGQVFGLGFRGDEIPAGSAIEPSLSLPADAAKLYMPYVTALPAGGRLMMWEDGSFDWADAPISEDSFSFQLWEKDGAAAWANLGTVTVTLTNTGVIAFVGSAQAASIAEGGITLRISLSGDALGGGAAAGSMIITRPISGAALTQALATGSLSIDFGGAGELAGEVIGSGQAAGDLELIAGTPELAGNAAASGSAAGNIGSSVHITLSGDAIASGVAQETTEFDLSGDAVAGGRASGVLSTQALAEGGALIKLSPRGGGSARGAGPSRPSSISLARRRN